MPDTQEQADPDMIWVVSDLAADGMYVASIQINQDLSIPLDRDAGLRYAAAVLAAAHRAQYDAAVYAQMTKGPQIQHELALHAIAGFRADRPPADSAATAPLDLRPGVNAAGKPFIALWLPGKQIGQLDVDQAIEHAVAVLEALEVVALDGAYFAWLRMTGLSEGRARYMVSDLSKWRGEEPAGDPT